MSQQDKLHHQRKPIHVDLAQDLHWLLQSQPLMDATQKVELFSPQHMGYNSTSTSEHLTNYPPQTTYRLGKHFEDCVDLLLTRSQRHTIINRNIIIQTPERTLGELDLLYRNAAQEVVHLELAIKYYLLEKGGTQLHHFIGPAGIDRLDLKWHRLCEHQLPLSKTPQVIDFLTTQNIPLPSRRQLLFTGMLFYAYQDWQNTRIEHLGLNPQHHRGWWLGYNEFDQLRPVTPKLRGFIVLPKWHWIGGPLHYQCAAPVSYSKLFEQATADPWPNMVLIYERICENKPWVFKNRGLMLTR